MAIKVLLIAPSFPMSRKLFSPENWFPPLGVTYLASILKKQNYEVDILDTLLVYMNFPELDSINFEHATEKLIFNNEYHIVGITVLSHTRIIAVNISKKIKEISPKTRIIWGGPHASIMYEQIINNYSDIIDAIVIGEGEDHIIKVINYFSKALTSNCKKGYISIFRSDNISKMILDNYPFPDYSTYPINSYKLKNISIIGSRGCPFSNCSYCPSRWIPFRERSIGNITKEIELSIDKYNIERVHFHDNTFTNNKNRTLDLFKEISEKSLPLKYSMKTRFDCIDEDIILMFCKIGGKTISFGLESGNQELRIKLGKYTSNLRIKYLTKFIKDHGLSFGVYVLFGHSEETDKDISQTISFLQEICPDEVIVSVICLFPGTELYYRAINEGKINENDWLTNKVYFTYVDEKRKQELFYYKKIINDMFPNYIEWAEYRGLYIQENQ